MNEGGDPDRYDVALTPTARRALTDRLPPAAAMAAWELIMGPLRATSYRLGKPLHVPYEGMRSARRATYRVLYWIDEDKRLVVVRDVQHRRDAYRA